MYYIYAPTPTPPPPPSSMHTLLHALCAEGIEGIVLLLFILQHIDGNVTG